MNLDDLQLFHIMINHKVNGWPIAIISILYECLSLAIYYLAKRLIDDFNQREVKEIQKKLDAIDPKENFKEYALTKRALNNAKKVTPPPYEPNFVWRLIHTSLLPIIFYNTYVCTFPNSFWTPMNYIVSIPFNSDAKDIKVGFSFFWYSMRIVSNFIYKKL